VSLFLAFFPLVVGIGKMRKGVYDDLEDVRDARKNIAPESGPGDQKGARYRSADEQLNVRRQRFVVSMQNESTEPIEHTRFISRAWLLKNTL